MEKYKICSKCNQRKSPNEFVANKHPWCKMCRNAYCRERYKTHSEIRQKRKDYAETNKEKRAIYQKAYTETHREQHRKSSLKWAKRNKPKIAKYHTGYYKINKERILKRGRKYEKRIRDEVFNKYGGYKCNCCGETEKLFLTIDHINNDGAAHRKKLPGLYRSNTGANIYRWLIRNSFPKGFQVLCYNCNCGKHRNKGICPHKKKFERRTNGY